MVSAPKCDLQIPRDLLDAVNTAKPVCLWYERGECRRGGKCDFLHRRKKDDSFQLPRVTRCIVGGKPCIQIRPPAKAMVNAFFEAKHMTCPLGTCRRVKGTPLLEFYFVEGCMQQPNNDQCHRAHSAGKVWVDIMEFRGKCSINTRKKLMQVVAARSHSQNILCMGLEVATG